MHIYMQLSKCIDRIFYRNIIPFEKSLSRCTCFYLVEPQVVRMASFEAGSGQAVHLLRECALQQSVNLFISEGGDSIIVHRTSMTKRLSGRMNAQSAPKGLTLPLSLGPLNHPPMMGKMKRFPVPLTPIAIVFEGEATSRWRSKRYSVFNSYIVFLPTSPLMGGPFSLW